MRIAPTSVNFFSNPQKNTTREANNRPSFGLLFSEEEFKKDLKKSKFYNEKDKKLYNDLIELTRDQFDTQPFKGSDIRFMLYKADKNQSDPFFHRDRAYIRVSYNGSDDNEYTFVEPHGYYERISELNEPQLKTVAATLVDWAKGAYHKLRSDANEREYDLDDAPPPPQKDDNWIDWFPM